jgi:hypothetical protein
MSYTKPVVTIDLNEYEELQSFNPHTEKGRAKSMEEIKRIYEMIVDEMRSEYPMIRFKSLEDFIKR